MLIAVDGPAAAGKGTLSRRLAEHFNLARLDTGLIYRTVAKKVLETKDPENNKIAIEIAQFLSLNDLDTNGLRDEAIGTAASKISAIPEVRKTLLNFQRNFAKNPPNGKVGAVLDGRDIGTVVCPKAEFKLFITASSKIRAERRFKELQDRGKEAIRSAILRDIIDRDERDSIRSVSPLLPARDAQILDTSKLDPDAVFNLALNFISLKI
ncbi:MAG TPA: (d)CMP kinase [Rhodospirillales bacterium]|nr:(d)CMP kinase [Rhodospirillales bacterium]